MTTALLHACSVLPTWRDAKCIFPESVHMQLVEVEENYKRLSFSLIDPVKTRYKTALCHETY